TTQTPDGWVFYSIDADLRLQSIMGLQTWNAIRALDFLASLPDVDPDRLAVTGGSGGGTQSILLGALDERIKVSFPNGMVSTSMQGGCFCENCNYLRVGTGNVELAALFAPRPQAMTAADDWTKEMMQDGYPELRWLYAMLGDENDVYCRPMLHFKHNYNYVTRATMYQWMNRHLGLGLDDPVVESDFDPLTEEETTVWTAEHPAPTNVGIDHERAVCKWLDDQANRKLTQQPRNRTEFLHFVELIGSALPVLYGVDVFPSAQQWSDAETIKHHSLTDTTLHGLHITMGLLRDESRGAELPLLTVRSASSEPAENANGDDTDRPTKVVVWTDGVGKDAAFDANGLPSEMLKTLAAQATVLLPDLLGQGEFNRDQREVTTQRVVDDKRSYSAFTFGYNRTLVAQRVGDLLSVVRHANHLAKGNIRLVATGGAAPWAAAAAPMIPSQYLQRTLIDTQGFRFANVESYRDANFVPGAVKYGDLPVLLAIGSGDRQIVGEPVEVVSRVRELSQQVPSAGDVRGNVLTVDADENLLWLLE
ncbi:MAG: hypothetical protein HKN47_25325, partial [Pirellulaceae bacterium]|nr:hypothetical protein [Pirellulaceae bacterium]